MAFEVRGKNVLVTGANGTIGNGVARAFVRAGYTVYGLIRNPDLVSDLAATEIIPIIGSPDNLDFLPELYKKNVRQTFDVIVSATENIQNYLPHFTNIITLLTTLSTTSNAHSTRPLILFTSGCKDYGTTPHHPSPFLTPHTETSPLNPPTWALPRATHSQSLISSPSKQTQNPKNKTLFDVILLRPTTIYGYHSSFYGPFFDIAAKAKEKGILELPRKRKGAVLHGMHIDDCGDAYVALANTYLSSPAGRELVGNKVYNISSYRYETLEEVAEALVGEYGVEGGVRWVEKEKEEGEGTGVENAGKLDAVDALTGFSQWVGSERLRRDTGWRDRRMLFSEGAGFYRRAYEVAVERGDLGVLRIRRFIEGR